MERVGLIVEKKGETAMVAMRRHEACKKCGGCGGFINVDDKDKEKFEVKNPINAKEGQLVNVEVDDAQMLRFSFVLYMLPVIALLVGVFGGIAFDRLFNYRGDEILLSVGIGVVLMLAVIVGIRVWNNRLEDEKRYLPVIKSLAEAAEDECEADVPSDY